MSHRRLPVKVTEPPSRPKRPRVTVATVHYGLAWRIGGFLKHPVVGLCLGVFATALLDRLSVAEMRPRFAVRKAETIASRETRVPGLQVLFRGKEVNVVRRARLVFWNAGDRPIDKPAISMTTPICIKYPSDVTLLDYRVVATSRPDLQIRLHPSSAGDQRIVIEVLGDDALERDDGALVELLYDGPEQAEFNLSGRIKGVRNGFEEESWDRAVLKRLKPTEWIEFLNMLIIAMIGALMLRREIQRYRAGEPNNLALGGYCFFPAMLANVWLLKPLIFGLHWAR